MSDDQLVVTRQELYELAWSKPMTELAREFGISDVALAKRCRILRIPVPGRGYWARVQAGQAPLRPTLPERESSVRRDHAVSVPPAPTEPSKDPARHALAADLADINAQTDGLTVRVSRELQGALGAVKRTALAHKHPDWRKLPFTRGEKGGEILDIRVTAGALHRALLFADALLQTAGALGWRFIAPVPKGNSSGEFVRLEDIQRHIVAKSTREIGELLVNGERIAFRIEERMREEPRDRSVADRKRTGGHRAQSAVTLRPTGALRLVRIDRSGWSERRQTWYDHRGRQIEERIPEILRGFFEFSLELKARRLDAERQRREREEEERKRRELAQRREANGKLVRALEIQAGAWHRARFLRAYLRAARKAAPNGLTLQVLGSRFDFLKWAEEYINGIDPTHEHPRSEAMFPETRSWGGASELKDEMARLLGHEWPDSWKFGPCKETPENVAEDLE